MNPATLLGLPYAKSTPTGCICPVCGMHLRNRPGRNHYAEHYLHATRYSADTAHQEAIDRQPSR